MKTGEQQSAVTCDHAWRQSSLDVRSRHVSRTFTMGPEGFRTVGYSGASSESDLIDVGTACEGSVMLDGIEFRPGRQSHGALGGAESRLESLQDGGRRLVVRFECLEPLPKGVSIDWIYETPDCAPVLIKYLRLTNGSDETIRLDGVTVESITPSVGGDVSLVMEDDYVRDAMTINGQRVYSPWIENHHCYIDAVLNTRAEQTTFAYPVPLDHTLAPGETFNSFRVFEFVMPTGDEEVRGLAFRRATRALFPWTRARYLCCKLAPTHDIRDWYRGIDTAAEAGFEAVQFHHGWIDGELTPSLFTNYSDYELRSELFPNGWSSVRKLTDYVHERGMTCSFYTIYVNTWAPRERNPRVLRENDWELVWAANDESNRWGITLDPATGWGPFVNDRIEEAIVKGGFDAWHLDGPYYGDICVAPNRDYTPGGPSQPRAWQRQVQFYRRMNALGIHGEAAQGFQAMTHGMSRITTTGYSEGDFGKLDMWEQIVVNRRAAYGFTRLYRPESATTSIPVMPWSANGDAPNLMPMEDHAAEYDAYLANVFGYGFEGKPFLRVAFEGPKSKMAITRWLTFWKTHAEFFKEGYLLHVREPDGRHLDAVVHVLPDATPARALLVAYNPLPDEQADTLDLSILHVAGLSLDGRGRTDTMQDAKLTAGQLAVIVPARNAVWVDLELGDRA